MDAASDPPLPLPHSPSDRLRQRGTAPIPDAPWPPPPAPRPEGGALLSLVDFTVRSRQSGVPIVNTSSVEAFEGEVVLLIGMSGAGKSLLMNTILGFIGPETPGLSFNGEIRVDGSDVLRDRNLHHQRMMGGVFQLQHLGLFDDLTTDQNLRFSTGGGTEVARRWREQLGLEEAPQVISRLSGGQRQRVALARALEQGAELILYDEPTSGLDPRAAAHAVELIQQHKRRLTVVISHDYRSFLPSADRVLLIDPLSRTIVDITGVENIPGYVEARTLAVVEQGRLEEPRMPGWLRYLKEKTQGALWQLDQATACANHYFWLALGLLVSWPIFLYRSVVDWRVRTQAIRYVLRFLGLRAVAFIGTAALLLGVVVTFFVFDRLPLREYTEPLLRPDLLNLLGVIIFRVTGPLITAILVSAKLGANITSTVGQMAYSRQVDALRLFNVHPYIYLFWPIVGGFLVGTVFLTALAITVSALVSLVFFLHSHPELTPGYWWYYFAGHFSWTNAQWVLAKTAFSAVGAGIICYRSGILPKESTRAIGDAINSTILRSLIWVLLVHGAFAFVEFGADFGPWDFFWQNLRGPDPPVGL